MRLYWVGSQWLRAPPVWDPRPDATGESWRCWGQHRPWEGFRPSSSYRAAKSWRRCLMKGAAALSANSRKVRVRCFLNPTWLLPNATYWNVEC